MASVSAGLRHTCAVRGDGSAVCWGFNAFKQSNAPAGTFSMVSAGSAHSCGLRTDGTVTCWGANGQGQSSAPAGTFKSVSAGENFTCGLRTDDTLACWGDRSEGQADAPEGSFTMVSAGSAYACAVRTDGSIACWGDIPRVAASLPTGTFTTVSAGYPASCGVRTDATVTCWGDDGGLSAPTGTFRAVSTGGLDACGLRTEGVLTCWGPDGGRTSAPGGSFSVLGSSLAFHTCAVRTDGTAACWGDNAFGQLGVAPETPSPSPADAVTSVPYTHTFTSGTGTPAGAFTVVAGELPAGLTLSPAGVLSGTPTNAATSTFTVQASDGVFTPATARFTLTVTAADNTPPTTTIDLDPADPTGTNGWYTGPVTATVTAADSGSGVASTRCALDAPTAATFADLPTGCAFTGAGATITGDGEHTLQAASVDRAGNAAPVTTRAVRIDTVAPTLSPTWPSPILLHQSGVIATPHAADATSGVAAQSCGPMSTATAGDHTLTCQATDNAGNQRTVQTHYTVEYAILGFASPSAGSTWAAGRSLVPVKVTLGDAAGVLIPDAEALALVNATPCRVTLSTSGAQTTPAQCMKYNPATNQFFTYWVAGTATGATTLTVTVTYPGSSTTTTRTRDITVTG